MKMYVSYLTTTDAVLYDMIVQSEIETGRTSLLFAFFHSEQTGCTFADAFNYTY